LERPEFFDSSTYLPNDLLVKTDMLGMRFGQEIRSPLLDDDLFASSMNLPHKYKVSAFNTKILLKDIARSLVPSPIIRRRKQGFAFPLEWLHAGKNNPFIRDILLSKSGLSDYVSISEIKRLIDKKKEHGNTQRLWQLVILQLWFLKGA
jgi:asparagine synthase (glutamine-hydrolysing)